MGSLYQGENMKSSIGVEYRKLQVTGGSTYIVSLPKRWITENNLKPSDTVGIEHLSSGEIQISPKENKNLRRTVDLDLTKYPRGALYDYLIGIYVSGADLITIRTKPESESRSEESFDDFCETLEEWKSLSMRTIPLPSSHSSTPMNFRYRLV